MHYYVTKTQQTCSHNSEFSPRVHRRVDKDSIDQTHDSTYYSL